MPPPVIFFDADSQVPDQLGLGVISDVARRYRGIPVVLEIRGHTDRTGSPAARSRVAMRRAEAVAAELVRLGFPRGDIVVSSFGDSQPRVPTAEGVPERQNRRVEVIPR